MNILLFVLDAVNTAPSLGESAVMIIVALIGLFSGGTIVKIYQTWLKNKNSPNAVLQTSLSSRIIELEKEVRLLQKEVKELMEKASKEILKLSSDKSRLETENLFLRKQIEEKDAEIKELSK